MLLNTLKKFTLKRFNELQGFFAKHVFVKHDSEYGLSIVKPAVYVFIFFILTNCLMYFYFYSAQMRPLTFPYHESFTELGFHPFKHRGGEWRLEDNGLIQKKIDGTDLSAVIPLQLTPYTDYYFSLDFDVIQGPLGAGVLFNMQDFKSRRRSHLVRLGRDKKRDYIVFGYFDEEMKFKGQGSVKLLTTDRKSTLTVLIKDDTYEFYLGEQKIKDNIRLQYHGGYPALTTWFSKVKFDNIKVGYNTDIKGVLVKASDLSDKKPKHQKQVVQKNTRKVIRSSLSKDKVTISQPTKLTWPKYWNIDSKGWAFGESAVVQESIDQSDKVILHRLALKKFSCSIEIEHLNNRGGGIIFSSQNFKNHLFSQMVRFTKDGGVIWGHFKNGKFISEGYQEGLVKSAKSNILQLVFDGNYYTIKVDDIVIASKIKSNYKAGFFGFVNMFSKSRFSKLKVYGVKK